MWSGINVLRLSFTLTEAAAEQPSEMSRHTRLHGVTTHKPSVLCGPCTTVTSQSCGWRRLPNLQEHPRASGCPTAFSWSSSVRSVLQVREGAWRCVEVRRLLPGELHICSSHGSECLLSHVGCRFEATRYVHLLTRRETPPAAQSLYRLSRRDWCNVQCDVTIRGNRHFGANTVQRYVTLYNSVHKNRNYTRSHASSAGFALFVFPFLF